MVYDQNPFETPNAAPQEAAPLQATGTFDIGVCLSEGWEAAKNNLGLLIGVTFVGMICMFLSYITILGIFLLVPIFMWGWARVFLNAYDGHAEFGDLFSGFQQYGKALGSTLLLMLVYIALGIPSQVLNITGAAIDEPMLSVAGQLVGLVITFGVTVRLYFAILFIVDQDMGAIEAVKASWEATSEQKLMTVVLTIVSGIIGLAGMLALIIGMFVTMQIAYMMYVSAYRQMVGRPNA